MLHCVFVLESLPFDVVSLSVMCHCGLSRRGFRRFCEGWGVQKFRLLFFFLKKMLKSSYFTEGERGPYQYSKRATISPPAKRHFNGVSLVDDDGVIFQGAGVRNRAGPSCAYSFE